MTNRFVRVALAWPSIGLVLLAGCAALRGGGKGKGTVRIHNATQGRALCKEQIGSGRIAKQFEQRIEPGAFHDFEASDPGTGASQQAVKIIPCDTHWFMTQNVEFSQGKQHLVVVYDGADPPKIDAPLGFVRYDLRNDKDSSELRNRPAWQDEKGVKPNYVFFTMRNKCDRQLEYKYEPSTIAEDLINPIPKDGHKFWIEDHDYVEVEVTAKQPITIWLRDRKGSGDWKEVHTMQPGTAARLEIDKSCKKVAERTDNERFHGCYEWAYSPACQLASRISTKPPAGCPEGTPSLEGDMSRTCQFETPKGPCIVRFARSTAGCDVR